MLCFFAVQDSGEGWEEFSDKHVFIIMRFLISFRRLLW